MELGGNFGQMGAEMLGQAAQPNFLQQQQVYQQGQAQRFHQGMQQQQLFNSMQQQKLQWSLQQAEVLEKGMDDISKNYAVDPSLGEYTRQRWEGVFQRLNIPMPPPPPQAAQQALHTAYERPYQIREEAIREKLDQSIRAQEGLYTRLQMAMDARHEDVATTTGSRETISGDTLASKEKITAHHDKTLLDIEQKKVDIANANREVMVARNAQEKQIAQSKLAETYRSAAISALKVMPPTPELKAIAKEMMDEAAKVEREMFQLPPPPQGLNLGAPPQIDASGLMGGQGMPPPPGGTFTNSPSIGKYKLLGTE